MLESISLLSGGTAAYTSIYMNLWYLGNSEVGKLVVEQGFRLSLTCCFFSCVSYPVTSLLVNVYWRKKCPKNVVSFRVYLSLSAFLREIIYNAADIPLCKNTISKPNQLEIQSYRSKWIQAAAVGNVWLLRTFLKCLLKTVWAHYKKVHLFVVMLQD